MDHVNKEQVTKFVRSSFLKEEEKSEILGVLDKEGVSENLMGVFKRILSSALNRIMEMYLREIRGLDDGFKEIDVKMVKARKDLDDLLVKKLTKINQEDDKEKERVWDEYYSVVKEWQGQYKDLIKNLGAGSLSSIIKQK